VPASTPIGEPIKMPSRVMMALPYSALSNPPSLPGGGVISVNRCVDMPAKPCETSVQRMAARQADPSGGRQRERQEGARSLPCENRPARCSYAAPAARAAAAWPARRDDREGDEEQQQTEAISEEVYRSPTASVNSLAMDEEIVVPGASKEVLMRCALPITKVTAMVSPERAAQSQHDAADDADARMRHHHVPDDFPGGGAQTVADSLSMGGTVSKTSRMVAAMNGSTMMASTSRRSDMPMPKGGPLNSLPSRECDEVRDQPGLHMPLQHRAPARTGPRCRK
jgi:hypothetical protein